MDVVGLNKSDQQRCISPLRAARLYRVEGSRVGAAAGRALARGTSGRRPAVARFAECRLRAERGPVMVPGSDAMAALGAQRRPQPR